MTLYQSIRRSLKIILAWMMVLIPILGIVQLPPSHAQEADGLVPFTWREAGVLFQLPAGWHVGSFEDLPMAASSEEALQKIQVGDAPDAPALAFLNYDTTNSINNVQDFLDILFPDHETTRTRIAGTDALQIHFDDEGTAQTVHVLGFRSPVTNSPQALIAVSPQGEWDAFAPTLEAILSSAQFLDGDAVFEFLDINLSFQYPRNWSQSNNGQVLAVAPEPVNAQNVLAGDFSTVPGFLRSQILVPSGIGIDAGSDTAPQEILERFTGEILENVHSFAWGEGLPAASVEFTFEGQSLLLVAVISGDTAVILGGGSPTDDWASYRPIVLGALNMAKINEIAPPLNLDEILVGTAEASEIFGATIGETSES